MGFGLVGGLVRSVRFGSVGPGSFVSGQYLCFFPRWIFFFESRRSHQFFETRLKSIGYLYTKFNIKIEIQFQNGLRRGLGRVQEFSRFRLPFRLNLLSAPPLAPFRPSFDWFP